MKAKNPLLKTALIAALALAGCSRHTSRKGGSGGGQTTTQQPPSTERQTPPAETENQAPAEQDKSAQQQQEERQRRENGQQPQLPPIPPPVAETAPPAPKAQPASPQDQNLTWTQRLSEEAASTRDYIMNKAKELSGSTAAMISPSEDMQRRRDALEAAQDESNAVRDRDLDQLAREVAATSPAPAQAVQAVLRPNDEVSTLLAAMLTEPDPARMNVVTSQLVDEIFNEPELARAKVMKVQLGLRRIAENNLYGDSLARRVAFLQANLDQRVKADQSAELLRDGLFVAGTSLALGTVAGFRGFERAREGVRGIHPTRAISGTRAKLASAWSKTKSGVSSIFRRGAAEGEPALTGVSGYLRRIRLPTTEVAARNLRALGVDAEHVEAIDLMKISRRDVPYQEFKATNMPGFRYAVLDKWDGADLGDERIVVFSFTRWERANTRPVFLGSRKMSVDEANALEGQIRFKTADEGGKDFMEVVDPATGAVTPTRMTSDEITNEATEVADEAAGGAAAAADEGKAVKRPRSRKSVSEAQADGDIPSTASAEEIANEQAVADQAASEAAADATESASSGVTGKAAAAAQAVRGAAQDVASKTKEVARGVASRSKQAVSGTVASIRPALRTFDSRWAATVAAGTAVPLYGFYYEGYGKGHDYGQGYETLYLESLIPHDRLQQITVDLSPDLAQ